VNNVQATNTIIPFGLRRVPSKTQMTVIFYSLFCERVFSVHDEGEVLVRQKVRQRVQ
jgi:hypothetical protein